MVAEDDPFGSGNKILVIPQSHAGHRRFGVELENLAGQPPSVGVVGHEIQNQRAECDEEGAHAGRFKRILTQKQRRDSRHPAIGGSGIRPGRIHRHQNGLTTPAPAFEIPRIGETPALGGLHLLQAAVDAIEEKTFAIGLFDQGKSPPGHPETGELFHKERFGNFEMSGDGSDLFRRNLHVTRPTAAVATPLALIALTGRRRIKQEAGGFRDQGRIGNSKCLPGKDRTTKKSAHYETFL